MVEFAWNRSIYRARRRAKDMVTSDGPPTETRGWAAILATPPKHLTRGELEWAFEKLLAENADLRGRLLRFDPTAEPVPTGGG